ncbi:signal peptidase II [Candidatus Similichlamydia epinepheli]|uniref:signal peptidase II n=1 Tax=Candidatus Similichlamydia epinepheli TaxID=1903953 RepID=UPI000D33A701|nr:signal peptidase II [Candidatus Similichlamydia epinepheli]
MFSVRSSFYLNYGCALGYFSHHYHVLFLLRLMFLVCFFMFVKEEQSFFKRILAFLAFVGGCQNLICSVILGGVLDCWEISFGSFVLNLNEGDVFLSSFFIFSFLQSFRLRKISG